MHQKSNQKSKKRINRESKQLLSIWTSRQDVDGQLIAVGLTQTQAERATVHYCQQKRELIPCTVQRETIQFLQQLKK